MSDRIIISDLLLRCIVGINEHERKEKQDVLLNIEMWADIAGAVKDDDLGKTVDYKVVNKQIIAAVQDSSFYLVESLASSVADVCLSHDRVVKVRVRVEKPGALRFARSVGVELTREKKGKDD